MARLPIVTSDQLDEAQQRVWDIVTGGRRGSAADLIDDQGGLIGPFNPMLYAPLVGERVTALGEALRFDATLERRLIELATITVAANWRSDFEWFVHARLAREAGVDPAAIESVRIGAEPSLEDAAEAVVHRFTRQLLEAGRPDDDTYTTAVELLGETAVVELVNLVGYYCLISFVLNSFEPDVPPSAVPPWPAR